MTLLDLQGLETVAGGDGGGGDSVFSLLLCLPPASALSLLLC
jgi:hypothetical protein